MPAYRNAKTPPPNITDALGGYDALTQQLLYNRGISTKDEANTFLDPDYETGRHDPFLLPGMEAAVSRILAAITQREHIAVFADYDCDGIPGAVILHDFFAKIEHEHVSFHIPHRHYEGFGLSESAVATMQEAGATLIITVDCGTADTAAVTAAQQAGIDVIVTDHHEPPQSDDAEPVLPNAHAIVNPKVDSSYPFSELCGAGVVFKLVEALIARGDFAIPTGFEKWWLDMVGIATIGDMVPLTGENRVLARFGLSVLRKSRRPGLQHLLRKTRASQQHLTEDDIGFTIGPRINAASRMDTPEDAFYMLATKDEADAGARVAHLETLNNERKGMVASMTKELKKRLTELIEIPDVIVLGSTNWRPSLVGLAANSLAETYRRPAFVWGRDGNGVIKGSCRSDGTTSVVALMNAVSDFFLEHGGHHMSGGFSVRDEHMYTLPAKMNEAYQTLGAAAAVEEVRAIDATLSLADVTGELVQTLTQFAPFGIGNPKPLFAFPDVVPERVTAFGKAKEHIRLSFPAEVTPYEAIAFFKTPDRFTVTPQEGVSCTLLAHIEQSFFMGRMQTRLRIVDIL